MLALSVHNTSLSPSPLASAFLFLLLSFSFPSPFLLLSFSFPSPHTCFLYLFLPLFLPSLSLSLPSLHPLSSLLPPSQNHIDVCVYRAVVCPNKGCEAVLPYHQLESHEQNCSFRRVTCEHCHTEITISQLEVRR